MPRSSRRRFLQTSSALVGAGTLLGPVWPVGAQEKAAGEKSPNGRWRIGCIGMRYQGSVITREALPFGDVVAIADVDRHVREQARASFGSTAVIYENYVDMLARKDLDVILIGAPDHWHAKMAIDACRSGRDVYVEKPVTLTIAEGQTLGKIVQETKRVLQVGSWQRSDQRFRLAAEMIRAGRLGDVKKATVNLGKNRKGGPFENMPAPGNLNWNLWLGQAPEVPYCPERCHYTFRFWYEYAGGEMTDTGAHHFDIALWALGLDRTGPVEIIPTGKLPSVQNGFNVATDFAVKFKFANGVEIDVLDEGRNGILFEGSAGRIFVNRGLIEGVPVQELATKPLRREDYQVYKHDNLDRPELSGKIDAIKNHMASFADAIRGRHETISDITSQHRSASACHLGNIALRLGRPLRWNPESERFVGDAEADSFIQREQRKGFEVA
ncbi:Gfo/Idh/MocA family protein [Planctomyces sp. SH-PL14]|uniref:Gfo/Idh/MocA family protein n=1 Tax=Planctomyces sp. SH-PL14 TaxID=1632864 RepID=UPI00078EBFEF|nr:Gfo/Idh/MocA family oxidoreductase [Planctomyces sp. SH-PL14]AMV18703.1 Inositol 2-dehydrogenase [Planctomyces sp. SH-PL14]